MRRVLSALSVGAFLILGSATPALGVDNIALVVEPQMAQSGGEVKLIANNCKRSTAIATFSPSILEDVTLRDSIGNDAVSGRFKIPEGAKAGLYTITAQCSGSDVRATQSLYVYRPAPAPHKAPATGGIALGGTSGAITTSVGVGLATLGGLLGFLAWRRRARPAD